MGSSHQGKEKPSGFCTVLLTWMRKKGKLLQVSGLTDGLVVSLVSVVECICVTFGHIKVSFKGDLLG